MLVNLIVVVLVKKLGPDEQSVFFDLPLTSFNVRWYHVFSTVAFVVANVWNFQLNRWWTFKSARHSGWWREYLPFLAVGLLALIANLAILTLLMHPGSPFSLSTSFFDDSTGFRTMYYWANAISIVVATPINFVLNKLWTFRSKPSKPVVVHETEPA